MRLHCIIYYHTTVTLATVVVGGAAVVVVTNGKSDVLGAEVVVVTVSALALKHTSLEFVVYDFNK